MAAEMKEIRTERMHLFDPNAYIAMCVRIAGNPCDAQIESAISKAVSCHESLLSKIVLKEDGSTVYEKATPSYQIQCCQTELTVLIEDFPQHPLDIFNAEMIRFYIIRNDTSLQLLIMAHHLAGDGLSIIYFIEDFMKALNGKELQFVPMELLKPQALPGESRIPFAKKLYLNGLNKQWQQQNIHLDSNDYYNLLKQYAKTHRGLVLTAQLNTDETSRLLQHAKKIGLSVNTLLITALLKEYGQEAVVGLPVSVRESDNVSMSNWVSGLAIKYHYNPRINFFSNAVKIQKQIYKLLQNKRKKYFVLQFMHFMNPSLIDSVYMERYSDFSLPVSSTLAQKMNYTGTLRDIGVTNLARVNLSNDNHPFTVENIVFVPPMTSYCQRTIGIITCEHTMNISMHSAIVDKSTETDYFTRAIQTIRTLNT